MRIIRTEAYFNHEDINFGAVRMRPRTDHRWNPGVSAAWAKGRFSYDDLAHMPELRAQPIGPKHIPFVLDAILLDERGIIALDALTIPGEVRNGRVIDYLEHQLIVIEQSPPSAFPFNHLTSENASLLVGTYLGLQAGGDGLLLFVHTAMGILVVGATIELNRALTKWLRYTLDRISGDQGGDKRL